MYRWFLKRQLLKNCGIFNNLCKIFNAFICANAIEFILHVTHICNQLQKGNFRSWLNFLTFFLRFLKLMWQLLLDYNWWAYSNSYVLNYKYSKFNELDWQHQIPNIRYYYLLLNIFTAAINIYSPVWQFIKRT